MKAKFGSNGYNPAKAFLALSSRLGGIIIDGHIVKFLV